MEMASTSRQSYSRVLQNDGTFNNEKANQTEESLGFSRETEVVAKFRQYISAYFAHKIVTLLLCVECSKSKVATD